MWLTVICYLHHYNTQEGEDFPNICFRNTEVFCSFTFWKNCHEITEAADSGSGSILYCIAFTCKGTQIISSKLNSCRDVKIFSMDPVLLSASWWFHNSQVLSPWGAFLLWPVHLFCVCPSFLIQCLSLNQHNWHYETVFHNKTIQSVSVPCTVLPAFLLLYLLRNRFSDAVVIPCHLH